MTQKLAEFVKDLAKSCNNVLEKLGWKWKPEMSEWYIIEATDIIKLIPEGGGMELGKKIPILHWEEIERVLDKIGYKLKLKEGLPECRWRCTLHKETCINGGRVGWQVSPSAIGWAKSRQEAVMRSVIQLGKEIDGKSK